MMKMNRIEKWKKALFFSAALGIIGLSTYGIYNTASAYGEFSQSQNSGYCLPVNSSSESTDPFPCGASCYPDGCAGCSGCAGVQYQQNTEVVPDYTDMSEL